MKKLITKYGYMVICTVVVLCSLFTGCESTRTNGEYYGREDTSEGTRNAIVDGMVERGSDRIEADAFTRALNDAQRKWESENR